MASLTFCLMSPRGGVGKSTTALLLASEIVRHHKTVTIIEVNANQHLKSWYNLGNCADLVSLTSLSAANAAAIEGAVFEAVEMSDYLIIDIQESESAAALHAASLSDIVLLPSPFSAFEVQGAMTTLNAIQALPDERTPALSAVLFTRLNAAIKTRAQSEIIASFDELAIPYVWPGVLDNVACRQMLKHGCLLHHLYLHTTISGVQNATNNIQAILRAIAARLN